MTFRAIRTAALLAAVALSLLAAATAVAHNGAPTTSASSLSAVVDGRTDPFTVGPRPPVFQAGPCSAQSATEQYLVGEGHDHLNISQHQFACRMQTVAFLPLLAETDNPATPQPDPNEILGEMDVKADIAAVSIAYPRGGILFFDVSDPARPKFISRYRGAECDGAVIDVDCGAFTDLSADGKTAFLSVQQLSVVPGGAPGLNEPVAAPGVDVVDVKTGQLTGRLPIESVGGVHTSRSHIIPEGPSSADKPRAPGEYLFSVANGLGVEVSRVVDAPSGGKTLTKVGRIDMDEVHDMFLQDDPLTGRTFMYIAAGNDTGFYVFDVTDPSQAVEDSNSALLAEWDLTPECELDWYSHTIDVATRNGRRYVTMPAELFDNGPQDEEDTKEGCGKVYGNGDKAGPLWIVDATDLDALKGDFADTEDTAAEEEATDAKLKAASEKALVTTWTNAANREGGNLNFSPHNQQIVGDRIYLSNYHAGVTVLDASAAFQGRNERPKETAFLVPSGTPPRPIYEPLVEPAMPFFQNFIDFRPLIWDMVAYKGHVLAADMTGGLYSLREENPPTPAEQAVQPADVPAQPRRCTVATGFRKVAARSRGRGLRLGFTRARNRPVTVDVFAVSSGRRILGERRVARFTNRRRSFTWNGRTAGIRDGYFLVRYAMKLGNGRTDVRRVTVRRRGGRFAPAPSSYRRASCGLLSSFKLERPVFGGATSRALNLSLRLSDAAAVTVTIRRGSRVVKRFASRARAANVTHRWRFGAERAPRGRYTVTVDATGGARRVAATLAAQRL